MMLTKEQLLAPGTRTKKVEVPERGGFVFVRAVTAAEAATTHLAVQGIEDPSEILAHQLALYLSKEDGTKLLTLEEARVMVKNLDGSASMRIAKEGDAFNAVDEKAVETARGN